MNNIAGIVNQLKAERDRLDRAISALSGVSNHRKSGKRTLSAAARERIRQAQIQRWQKFRAGKEK